MDQPGPLNKKIKKKFFYGHQKTDLLIFLYFNTKTEIWEKKIIFLL